MSTRSKRLSLLAAAWVILGACGQDATTPPVSREPPPSSPPPVLLSQTPPPLPPPPRFQVWPVTIPHDSLFEPIAEVSFAQALPAGPPAACAQSNSQLGCWFVYDPDGNYSIALAADAPESPPGVLRIRFPAGLTPGYGPGLFQGWSTPSESGSDEQYRAIRESGWIRVPSASFEMQQAGVKFLGYVGVGQQREGGIPSQILFWSDTPSPPGPWGRVNLNLIQQAFQERKLPQNVVVQPLFTFGTWHHYEYLMVVNDLGKANGRLQVWWDGVQILDYGDVEYRTEDNPAGFYGRRWDPIWGGRGGLPHTRDDYLEIDHIVIRGVPMNDDGH